jgi:hypothetical protein
MIPVSFAPSAELQTISSPELQTCVEHAELVDARMSDADLSGC